VGGGSESLEVASGVVISLQLLNQEHCRRPAEVVKSAEVIRYAEA
jgi:hypothetical protein